MSLLVMLERLVRRERTGTVAFYTLEYSHHPSQQASSIGTRTEIPTVPIGRKPLELGRSTSARMDAHQFLTRTAGMSNGDCAGEASSQGKCRQDQQRREEYGAQASG